jgi:dihydroorotase
VIGLVGGTVWGPHGPVRADVWVEGDTVVAVGTAPGKAERVIDVTGTLVGPGFVDLHTHLRDPGQTWKEDLRSGTAAAAAGGFTAVVAMPNTVPATDSVGAVEDVRSRAAGVSRALVAPASALTLGREGKVPVDLEALWAAGVRVFTDDGDWVADAPLMEEVMSRAARLPGAVVAQHAEDPVLSGGGHMHEGQLSRRAGVAGIPPAAETEAVARDLELAVRTGAHLHVQHVSVAATLELVAEARERGAKVTMEVTPHHLDFTVADLEGLDPNLKMYPPVREPSDREALRRALLDGVIDAVATDHAPHREDEKQGFEHAARGVIGLETAASVVWGLSFDPDLLFGALSARPARIAGLERHGRAVEPGSPANLVVFDPERRWVPDRFVSRSSNSPYRGREMRGVVVMTIWEGKIVHEEAA